MLCDSIAEVAMGTNVGGRQSHFWYLDSFFKVWHSVCVYDSCFVVEHVEIGFALTSVKDLLDRVLGFPLSPLFG